MMNTLRGLMVCVAAVLWAQVLHAQSVDQTYTVPIYVQGNRSPANHLIYVSDGSAAVPYLFDTGSPNMFTVQGVPEIDRAGLPGVMALIGGSLGLLKGRRRRN